MTRRRTLLLIFALFCIGWLYVKTQNILEATLTEKGPIREPLFLPSDFDNSFQIDAGPLEKVRDYTILDNDQRRWDRGFWPCLELMMTLSPEEISRRAQIIDFETIDNESDSDQAARDKLRGQIVRIQGYYQPDTLKHVELPANPLNRQFLRLGVVGKPQSDLLRINVPEAWLVYFLDDSNANKGDTVQVEGAFFKIMKFTSQKNDQTYFLPVLVARTPTVVKAATENSLNDSSFSTQTVQLFSILCVIAGILVLGTIAYKRHKKSQFKNEVLRKIEEKKKT